tara:strand:+ start:356 stop:1360 length:1005 start_codon:yes stop_codon:yes gene_type:complete
MAALAAAGALVVVLTGLARAETGGSGTFEKVSEPTGYFEEASGVVHLTFDDGPDEVFTPVLLDLLDHYGIKATFFPLGRNLKSRWEQDDVQELLSRGHAIGNHSWHHRRLTEEHPFSVAADLEEASLLLQDLAGFRPSCWRAPYGERNEMVLAVAGSLGMEHVGWTADPQEWQNPWVPVVLAYLTEKRHDGSTILLHDRKWLSLHIVDAVVSAFRDDGWGFEVVDACRTGNEREARMATRTEGDVPVGRVEGLTKDGEDLLLTGWAYDADAPEGGLEVVVNTDGLTPHIVGATGIGHDFAVVLPSPTNTVPICVWVANAGRSRHDTSLGCHHLP